MTPLNGIVLITGWIIIVVICWGVAMPLMIWIIDKLLGRIEIVGELRRKNMAVAIVLSSIIIGISLLIGLLFGK